MNNTIKLSDEEIKKIDKFRNDIGMITLKVGDILLNILNLENEIKQLRQEEKELINQYDNIKHSEKEFITSLKNKYGDGGINFNSGEFIKL